MAEKLIEKGALTAKSPAEAETQMFQYMLDQGFTEYWDIGPSEWGFYRPDDKAARRVKLELRGTALDG